LTRVFYLSVPIFGKKTHFLKKFVLFFKKFNIFNLSMILFSPRFAFITAMFCGSLLFSCTPKIDPPPFPLSSSGLSSEEVLCLFGGICTYVASEDCSAIQGQIVQSCPEESSSSGGVNPPPYSSSSGTYSSGSRSSSSRGGLSSSSLSSNTGLCLYSAVCLSITAEDCSTIGGQIVQSCPAASSSSGGVSPPPSSSSSGSECVGSGSYCNYGGCAEWSSDGWSCARHINGYLNEGGCYPMPTEDNCQTGTLVSVCPANATPPTANYCKIQSSSSSVTQSSSSKVPSSSSVALVVSSSSSVAQSGLCAGFVSGTTREHYGKDKPQFCDERDGKKYVYVQIGTQTWMAENLYYNASGSKCGNGSYSGALSDDNSATCDIYGRLYNWETAKKACPSGWHFPSKTEWDVLASYVQNDKSCTSCIAKHLNSASGWNGGGNGLDSYGFSALPGGTGSQAGRFGDGGYDGLWWSIGDDGTAFRRHVGYNCRTDVCWGTYKEDAWLDLYSVRCLRN